MMEQKGARASKTMQVEQIPMAKIVKPVVNMRERIDQNGIESLANDIDKNGLISPITVYRVKQKFVLIAGLRRYLAFKRLERTEIPGIVRQATGDEILRLTFSENAQRENPSIFDEAKFLKQAQVQLGLTYKELGEMIGKGKAYISERLAVLDYPPDVSLALEEGTINFSVAREFAKITDDQVRRNYLNYAGANGITPRAARQWVYDWRESLKEENAIEKEEIREKGEGYIKAKKFLYPCSLCDEPYEMADMTHLNACPKCMELIESEE